MKDQLESKWKDSIVVPHIVDEKLEDAFGQIKKESEMKNTNKVNESKAGRTSQRKYFPKSAVAAACIGLLALGGVTAYATVRHFWYPGTQGAVQASEEDQQQLVEDGMAVVTGELENYEDLAVTSNGITITPETIISDGTYAHLIFSVQGAKLEEDEEPAFGNWGFYLGEDPDAEDAWMNTNGSFYNGIVANEEGRPSYADGSEPELTEDGSLKEYFMDEEGNLTYTVTLRSPTGISLLGKTIRCYFEDFGTTEKADFDLTTEAVWDFTVTLPEQSSSQTVTVNQQVEDTPFVITTMEVSPISVMLNFDVEGEVEITEDENGIPFFGGFVMKDGTRLPYLFNGGGSWYEDDNRTMAVATSVFDRVIDPDQVAGILFIGDSGDIIEVMLSE